jgi:uncharacterized metal-binding protein
MRVVLRPLPVLYACAGQSVSGAREVAAALDRRGWAESASVPAPGADPYDCLSRARSRFPVYVIDGCANACASRFLESHNVHLEARCVLSELGASDAAELADCAAERLGALNPAP